MKKLTVTETKVVAGGVFTPDVRREIVRKLFDAASSGPSTPLPIAPDLFVAELVAITPVQF